LRVNSNPETKRSAKYAKKREKDSAKPLKVTPKAFGVGLPSPGGAVDPPFAPINSEI
jgi:hypothetical protein